jgi:hypothetical protein
MVINGSVNPSTERNVVPIIPSRAFSFKDDTAAAVVVAVVVNEEEDGDDDNTDGDGNVGLTMMIIDVSPSTNHDIVSYHHSIHTSCRATSSKAEFLSASTQITNHFQNFLENVVCIVVA